LGDDGAKNYEILRLGFQRRTAYVSRSEFQKLCETVRDKSEDTIAESIAREIDKPVWDEFTCAWITKDPAHFGTAAEQVSSFQEATHKFLVGQPTETLAFSLRLPDAQGMGLVAEQVPIDSIDNPLKPLKRCIEVIGIVVGVMTGNPVLATASAKALVHDEFHHALVKGVKRYLFGPHPEGRVDSPESKVFRRMGRVDSPESKDFRRMGRVEPAGFRPYGGGWGRRWRG